jgi:hypothetical protein
VGPGIDPCGAGFYNLMCSGSSSRFAADLLVWESGGSRYMVVALCEERVDHKRMQGTAEKARDGAPKAG